MTKIQIVKIANSLEMFCICFFLFGICLSFVACHLEFNPKKATI
jgi:hypothetical protein